jgi:hypothetical protein
MLLRGEQVKAPGRLLPQVLMLQVGFLLLDHARTTRLRRECDTGRKALYRELHLLCIAGS